MTAHRSLRVPVLAFLAISASLLISAPSAAAAGALSTWVSGVGDDVNPCSRTAPCKTFAGAISKTESNGEIRALDPAGFGAVTIVKPITITGEGTLAAVLHSSTYGIQINAGADDEVVLSDLTLHGAGTGGADCTGTYGIRILSAKSVTLKDLVISGNNLSAIEIAPTVNPVTVVLDNVTIQDNCTRGINVAPVAGQAVGVLVNDTLVTRSGVGLRVTSGGRATVDGSTFYDNATGILTEGTGIIDLSFSSLVRGNVVDGVPTSSFGQAGPSGAAGPAGPQGATGAVVSRLLVVPSTTRLRLVRGRTVPVTFVTTERSNTTLTVKRNGRQVAKVFGASRRGGNRLVWNGKAGRAAAPAGLYFATLRSVGTDGQVATATVRVTIVAPRG